MEYPYENDIEGYPQLPPVPILDIRIADPTGNKIDRIKCILSTATSQTKIPKKFIKKLGIEDIEIQGKTKGYLIKISLGSNYQFPTVVGLTETATEYGYLGRDILNKLVLFLDGKKFRILRD